MNLKEQLLELKQANERYEQEELELRREVGHIDILIDTALLEREKMAEEIVLMEKETCIRQTLLRNEPQAKEMIEELKSEMTKDGLQSSIYESGLYERKLRKPL